MALPISYIKMRITAHKNSRAPIMVAGILFTFPVYAAVPDWAKDETPLQVYHKAMASCDKTFVNSKMIARKAIVGYDQCRSNALITLTHDSNFPFMWTVDDFVNANHASVVAYAKRKITAKELKAQISANRSQFEKNKHQAAEQKKAQEEADRMEAQLARQQQLARQAAAQQQQRCILALAQAQMQPTLGGSSMAALANGFAAMDAMGCN